MGCSRSPSSGLLLLCCNMGNGWIKLHRKLLENPLAKKPAWAWLWVVLLLKANHEKNDFIWNGKVVRVRAGQFVTGRLELAKESSLSPSSVERALEYLESGHQIEQQKTTKYRLITIVKWSEYQHEKTTKRTTGGQQADTNKNEKNDNKRLLLKEKPPTLEERARAQKIKDDLTAKFKMLKV